MKLGTESKNKTIAAAVLLGVALIFLSRWLFMSGSSAPSVSAKVPATSVRVEAQSGAQPAAGRRTTTSRRSDQKPLIGGVFTPSLDPTLNMKMLETSENVKYAGTGRNIFESTPEPKITIPNPVAPGRTPQAQVPTPPPGPTAPPPINLKFYGYSTKSGQKTIFLSQGTDAVFVAHEGDIIARRYKIVRINPSSVEVQDMLSNNKQTITLTAG